MTSFVAALPTVEALMPALSFAAVAGDAEPLIAEQLVSSNALRQRRYRERRRALHNVDVTPQIKQRDGGSEEPPCDDEEKAARIRAIIRCRWPSVFDHSARSAFLQHCHGPREKGGYPLGFHGWTLAGRDAWLTGSAPNRRGTRHERGAIPVPQRARMEGGQE